MSCDSNGERHDWDGPREVGRDRDGNPTHDEYRCRKCGESRLVRL